MNATTAAARLIPVEPESPEWHEARRQGVTASEIAVVLGISPFDSAFNLYWKKVGTLPDDYDNDRLSLGRHLEPWIADRFAEQRPEFYVRDGGLYASAARPWQLSTPDRLLAEYAVASDPVAVLEIKTSGTYDGWGDDGSDEIPAYIRAQVLWQMDTLGLTTAFVCCLFLGTQQIRTYEIKYDAADVELMRAAALAFLIQLRCEEPPPIDSHPATTTALKRLHPKLDDTEATVPADVAEDYRWAHQQLKAAKEQAQLADNRIRDAMAGARVAVDDTGEKVCSRSIYEVAAHEVAAFTVDKLSPARRKKTAP